MAVTSRRRFLAGLAGTAVGAVGVGAVATGCGRTDDPALGQAPSTGPPGGGSLEPDRAVAYGSDEDQVADLHLPEGVAPSAGWPVAVLLHGGFWRTGFDRELMEPLARSVVEAGVAVWNVEYRRSDHPAGGWTGTFDDVAAAIEALAGVEGPIDLDRVLTVGHSAGGHLALWAAARGSLPDEAPGAAPTVPVRAAVALAPITDLVSCARQGIGGDACFDLMGGAPGRVPDRYRLGSPIERLPLGVPQVLVHGTDDDIVPVSQSRDHARAAQARGDRVDLHEYAGADHFDLIAPDHPSWQAVLATLPELTRQR